VARDGWGTTLFSRVEQAVSFSTVADRRLMLEGVERPDEIDIWSDEGEEKTQKRKKKKTVAGRNRINVANANSYEKE